MEHAKANGAESFTHSDGSITTLWNCGPCDTELDWDGKCPICGEDYGPRPRVDFGYQQLPITEEPMDTVVIPNPGIGRWAHQCLHCSTCLIGMDLPEDAEYCSRACQSYVEHLKETTVYVTHTHRFAARHPECLVCGCSRQEARDEMLARLAPKPVEKPAPGPQRRLTQAEIDADFALAMALPKPF